MIRINLYPYREAQNAHHKQVLAMRASACAVVLGVCAFFHQSYMGQVEQLQADRMTFLKQQEQSLQAEVARVEAAKKQLADLSRKIDVVQNLTQQKATLLRAMSKLNSDIPKNAQAVSLSFDTSAIALKGRASTVEDVAQWFSRLEKAQSIKNPSLQYLRFAAKGGQNSAGSATAPRQDDVRYHDFELSIPLVRAELNRAETPVSRTTANPAALSKTATPTMAPVVVSGKEPR